MAISRDARLEADLRLGPGRFGLVLEPSPPAVHDGPLFADDPLDHAGIDDATIVSPVSGVGDLTWAELSDGDADLAAWARARWLGPWHRLGPAPDGLAGTRLELHRLVAWVLSPARQQRHHGKIGLRRTHDGFGTPFFGDGEQLRVEGMELVHQQGERVRSIPVTSSLAEAAALAGVAIDPDEDKHVDVPRIDDLDRPLAVDPEAASFLADWFGFGWSVLEEVRSTLDHDSAEVSAVQLWAEHFDPAFEAGRAEADQRASFGASPGDAAHDEPYLYVAAWSPVSAADDPFWNGEGFQGAELRFADLLDAPDQRGTAIDFFQRGLATLGVG